MNEKDQNRKTIGDSFFYKIYQGLTFYFDRQSIFKQLSFVGLSFYYGAFKMSLKIPKATFYTALQFLSNVRNHVST